MQSTFFFMINGLTEALHVKKKIPANERGVILNEM